MNVTRIKLVAVFVVAAASTSFADLRMISLAPAEGTPVSPTRLDGVVSIRDVDHQDESWSDALAGDRGLTLAATKAALPVQHNVPVVREIHPGPGSLGLFLSAVLSFGGWHFARSAKDFRFGVAPEWYHTGGPVQIGHATPFDLSFATLPLCSLEQPVEQRPYLYRIRRDNRPCLADQTFLLQAAARGPPLSA